jgi:GTPase
MIDPSNYSEAQNRDYLNVIFALNLPLFVILSKSEKCSTHHVDSVLSFLSLEISRHQSMLLEMESPEDIILSSRTFVNEKIVPVFTLSLKTHKNTDIFVSFLNLLPQIHVWDSSSHSEFFIEKCKSKEEETLLTGFLKKGSLKTGQEVFIGPDNSGNFIKTQIFSIKVKDVESDSVSAGHFCSILVGQVQDMREGMVMVDRKELAKTTFEFQCWVCPINTFKGERETRGYKPMIYMQNTSQQACVLSGPASIVSGETMKFRFRFLQRPEYLIIGTRIMVNDEFITAMGTVSSIGY